MKSHSIYWWKTPPESSDLNPIENVWHELKEYIRREEKPRTKDQLILAFGKPLVSPNVSSTSDI